MAFAEAILLQLRQNAARLADYVAGVKRGEFSNAWVDAQLSADGCIIRDC
jgi:hypothetical protein